MSFDSALRNHHVQQRTGIDFRARLRDSMGIDERARTRVALLGGRALFVPLRDLSASLRALRFYLSFVASWSLVKLTPIRCLQGRGGLGKGERVSGRSWVVGSWVVGKWVCRKSVDLVTVRGIAPRKR